jgi:hypothetical protein
MQQIISYIYLYLLKNIVASDLRISKLYLGIKKTDSV